MGRDLGRGVLGIADDRDVAVSHAAVLDRLDRGRGQIDDDVAVVEREIEPSKAVGAGGELVEAHRRRNVDLLQRRAGDDPGLAQPHARLEAFHRGGQSGVPRQAARLPRVQVAFDRKALAQFRDRRALRPRASATMSVGQPPASTIAA